MYFCSLYLLIVMCNNVYGTENKTPQIWKNGEKGPKTMKLKCLFEVKRRIEVGMFEVYGCEMW